MRADFPLPDLSWPATAEFWRRAARNELAIPRCEQCGRWVWYPQDRCPICGGTRTPWTAVSGRGWLYSWSVVRHIFLPAYADLVPYVVGLVALAEDPLVRVAGRIAVDPGAPIAECPVEVTFAPLRFAGVEGEVTAPVFRPVVT